MLRELSSAQIADWIAYSAIEPFGHRAADMSAAMIAHAVHNRLRGKDESPIKLETFRLTHVDPEPDMDEPPERVWSQVAAALGAFPRMGQKNGGGGNQADRKPRGPSEPGL